MKAKDYRIATLNPLGHIDPDNTSGLSKKEARKLCRKNQEAVSSLSYCLDAQGDRSVLVILQGMDGSGKDGAVRHFIDMLNPQSCDVVSFKEPTPEELGHDFLWRVHARSPRKGRTAIFNRSHYEDVLVVKVHELLGKKDDIFWQERYEQIRDFEQTLASQGTTIIKIFLHISQEEQRKRLLARLEEPERHWKFSAADLKERKFWDDYRVAYEQAMSNTDEDYAPWYIVPANHKWHRDAVISTILRETLEALNPHFPQGMSEKDRVAAIRKLKRNSK